MTVLDTIPAPTEIIDTRISAGTTLLALHSSPTPMDPTCSAADNELIHKLLHISKNPKLIKGSDYVAPGAPEMTIRSWKMNEFKYNVIPCPFPTLARGLFTTAVDEGKTSAGRENRHRIVIRGYDKFFNIGEVPWTSVCDTVDSMKDFPRLIEHFAVELSRSTYSRTIHSLPKVKRLHHIHCRSHPDKTLGHFKTFSWTRR